MMEKILEKLKENLAVVGFVAVVIVVLVALVVKDKSGAGGVSKESVNAENTEVVESDISYAMEKGVVVDALGKEVLAYSFDLRDGLTATATDRGAYLEVSERGIPVMKMYMSYVNGGMTAERYMKNVITPKIAVVEAKDSLVASGFSWNVWESATMSWHVATPFNGAWLVMVEGEKEYSADVVKVLSSLVLDNKVTE